MTCANKKETTKCIYIHSIYIVKAQKMAIFVKNKRLSYGYPSGILRLSFGTGSQQPIILVTLTLIRLLGPNPRTTGKNHVTTS